jgi:hypothetical protein
VGGGVHRQKTPEERKAFFFEKKKQKTFALAPSSPDVLPLQLARNPTDKSFLILFFKKEHLLP